MREKKEVILERQSSISKNKTPDRLFGSALLNSIVCNEPMNYLGLIVASGPSEVGAKSGIACRGKDRTELEFPGQRCPYGCSFQKWAWVTAPYAEGDSWGQFGLLVTRQLAQRNFTFRSMPIIIFIFIF